MNHPVRSKWSRFSLVPLVLGLLSAVSAGAAESSPDNCYGDVCVGDRAINVAREYREVTVIAIDNFGKFVLRFSDNGGTGGNWDRSDLALMRGCAGDLCVGYPVYNVTRDNRKAKIHALQQNGRFVLRFDDNGGVGGNWDAFDLALPWGCAANFCVNDTVYNVARSRQAQILAIQTNSGGAQKFLLRFTDNGGIGGGWDHYDLALISRGPIAYPPNPETPNCPPGYRWDPYSRRCERVANPNPTCPPGYVWDHARQTCVRAVPPPPPPRSWQCTINRAGRVFNGHGNTRGQAMAAVLRGCTNAGYSCRSNEAYCRQ